MAVDQENLTAKIQSSDIPTSNAPQKSPAETPSKTTKQSKSNPEVQDPSTITHNEHGDEAVRQPEQTRSNPSDAQTEVAEDEPKIEMEGNESSDHNAELPEMDWLDFQNRYKEAIMKANDEEQELLVQFEKYAEVFRIWSLATAQRDNDRGWKRLKTRQRYVELAETKLDDKKKHYEEVVQAFQKALELLRGPP